MHQIKFKIGLNLLNYYTCKYKSTYSFYLNCYILFLIDYIIFNFYQVHATGLKIKCHLQLVILYNHSLK